MPASSDVPQPTGQEPPRQCLSRWSVGSLVFLVLGTIFVFLFYWAPPRASEGDPAGVVGLFVIGSCFLGAWCCSLLGIIAGWVGVRRSPGKMRLAMVALVFNVALFFLAILSLILVLFR